MEGVSESFGEFIKYVLIFAVVFYIGSILKADLVSRGVFGVQKQNQLLQTSKPSRVEIFSNNPATVRRAW